MHKICPLETSLTFMLAIIRVCAHLGYIVLDMFLLLRPLYYTSIHVLMYTEKLYTAFVLCTTNGFPKILNTLSSCQGQPISHLVHTDRRFVILTISDNKRTINTGKVNSGVTKYTNIIFWLANYLLVGEK
jgi:hypothetical protein